MQEFGPLSLWEFGTNLTGIQARLIPSFTETWAQLYGNSDPSSQEFGLDFTRNSGPTLQEFGLDFIGIRGLTLQDFGTNFTGIQDQISVKLDSNSCEVKLEFS